MIPKHAILKSNGIVECWETERLDEENFHYIPYGLIDRFKDYDRQLNSAVNDWLSSKKEYKCYEGEFKKIINHLYQRIQKTFRDGHDVTGLVEIKYIGRTEPCEQQAAFFLPPKVETETQDDIWNEAFSIFYDLITSYDKGEKIIKSKFTITRKQ